jgi:glutathione synthase/RimK-type ligase-like ATP-grasp enzyme
MQKPLDRWQPSGWVARWSKRDMIVTNMHRGGENISIERALKDNNWEAAQIAGELSNLAHLISSVLDNYYGFRVLGLDLAVDNKGKVWFIEANTNPLFRQMFKAVGMHERVMNTHRFIVEKYS